MPRGSDDGTTTSASGKRTGEHILYTHAEQRALRGLVAGVAHRSTVLHNALLEACENSADATLRNAEAEHG